MLIRTILLYLWLPHGGNNKTRKGNQRNFPLDLINWNKEKTQTIHELDNWNTKMKQVMLRLELGMNLRSMNGIFTQENYLISFSLSLTYYITKWKINTFYCGSKPKATEFKLRCLLSRLYNLTNQTSIFFSKVSFKDYCIILSGTY